jgi:signal peptidase I
MGEDLASPAPAPRPVRRVRANRVILVIGAILTTLLVVAAALLILGARSLGLSPGSRTVRVIGSAMAPTVQDGDYLLVWPYGTAGPAAGDIILMRDPYDPSREFITRIVAGPGQTIEIRDANVIVDGRPLSEPYLDQEPWVTSADWPRAGSAVTLGPDEYFVLGDNRNHSTDSRVFGPIHRGELWGRAVRILIPSARARPL